jgi:hypothetical protein
MSKITVICGICGLKFSIPERLSDYTGISCYKNKVGHTLNFEIEQSNHHRKTIFTIEDAMKNIEENLKH